MAFTQCENCKSNIEFHPEDLEVDDDNLAGVKCTCCGYHNIVDLGIIEDNGIVQEHNETQKFKKKIQSWGLDTIVVTMYLRAIELGNFKLEPERFMKSVLNEAKATSKDLWKKAESESSDPAELSEVFLKFSRNVMAWCANLQKNNLESRQSNP